MARYYRRRYTRVVKPKKKWATNIRSIVFDTGATPLGASRIGLSQVLCANSAETFASTATAPTPTIVKCGNFKVQCDALVTLSSNDFMRLTMYILYIPEGVFVASSSLTALEKYETDEISLGLIIQKHPEWILAWRQFDSQQGTGTLNSERVSFSSRLKRNLNSGDQIYAVFLAHSGTGVGTNVISRVVITGTCQFWTCTN